MFQCNFGQDGTPLNITNQQYQWMKESNNEIEMIIGSQSMQSSRKVVYLL